MSDSVPAPPPMTRTRWGRTVWWLAAVRPSDGRVHWWWDRTEAAHLARLAGVGEGWVVVGRIRPSVE